MSSASVEQPDSFGDQFQEWYVLRISSKSDTDSGSFLNKFEFCISFRIVDGLGSVPGPIWDRIFTDNDMGSESVSGPI